MEAAETKSQVWRGSSLVSGLALLVRLLHGWRVDMPSNDGVQYLWQALCFAEGDLAGGMQSALPPGLGFALAPWVALGLEPEIAAELLLSFCGAGAALLLYLLARVLALREQALLIGLAFALSPVAVRFAAEAYSEPLFLLLTSGFALAWQLDRLRLAALLLGVAYWVRPEAAAFGVLLLGKIPSQRRVAVQAAALAIVVALLEPMLRWWVTGEFLLTPLLGFYGDGLIDHGTWLDRLMAWPRAALEGYLALLVVAPFLFCRGPVAKSQARSSLGALWAAFALLQFAQLGLQVKPRFFESQLALVLLLLAAYLRRGRLPPRLRALPAGLLLLLILPTLGDLWGPPRIDKAAERAIGIELRKEGIERGELVTDMPRVAYFAGLAPPPPAEWTNELLLQELEAGRARVLVLGAKRPGRVELTMQLRDSFYFAELPAAVEDAPGSDRLLVMRARETGNRKIK